MIVMIVNAENAVLGRMATAVAKKLIAGESVEIINADKAIITGNPDMILKKYLIRRRRGSPQHGPFFPKQPDRIVRRAVRGMLPYKTQKGRKAFRKLRVFVGMPDSIKEKNIESLGIKEISCEFMTIGKLAKSLGWSG